MAASVSGLDLAAFDTTVRPQDDLFGYANGTWLATNPIPEDKGRYGVFDQLRERAEADVRVIVEQIAAGQHEPGTSRAKVGDLYRCFMDEASIEAKGVTPLQPLLERIDTVTSPTDLMRQMGALMRQGVDGILGMWVASDHGDPTINIVYLNQGGIGLPDEAYYREDTYADKRQAYVAHIERMARLAGWEDPAGFAQGVMNVETRIAAGHWDRVTCRDAVKTYSKLTRPQLDAAAPGVDWSAFLDGLGAPTHAFDQVVVRQQPFLDTFATAVAEEPLEHWRQWLRWRVLSSLAPSLSSAFVDEAFDFNGRTLSGVPELRARWKRGLALVEGALGEAVGQEYVAKHFPPQAKAQIDDLVRNVVEAFRRSFASLEWMGEETRAAALEKLRQFDPMVGYPATWRDYSALHIEPDDLIGNVGRAAAFEVDREFAKLGEPVDRGEWFMTPQTVNAYYNPGLNQIVFPAAILQPPFFSPDVDPALNYGGIGAVIGHEIGHGFDDAGSHFDGVGMLREWWTDDDRARFTALSQRLIDQFNTAETRCAPGKKVNGALTLGENIGDLGGLAIGYSAYRIACGDQEPPVMDGFTGAQRFFLNWAQIWCGMAREEEAVRLLSIDPHSPQDVRAHACRNFTEFHEAFDVKPSDGMWLEPDQRVRIF